MVGKFIDYAIENLRWDIVAAVMVVTLTFYLFGRFRLSSEFVEEQPEMNTGGTTSSTDVDVEMSDDIDRIEDLEYTDMDSDSAPEMFIEREIPETARQIIERQEREIIHGGRET